MDWPLSATCQPSFSAIGFVSWNPLKNRTARAPRQALGGAAINKRRAYRPIGRRAAIGSAREGAATRFVAGRLYEMPRVCERETDPLRARAGVGVAGVSRVRRELGRGDALLPLAGIIGRGR